MDTHLCKCHIYIYFFLNVETKTKNDSLVDDLSFLMSVAEKEKNVKRSGGVITTSGQRTLTDDADLTKSLKPVEYFDSTKSGLDYKDEGILIYWL